MPIVWPTRVKRASSTSIWRSFRGSSASSHVLARVPVGRCRCREQRVPVVDVEVETRLPLVCQRCLGVVEVPVDSRARVAVVADLAAADALGAELDPFIAADGKVVLLPHMSSATIEGRVDMGEKVVINIRTFFDGHRPPDRVLPSRV